jgi:hypothetical protein
MVVNFRTVRLVKIHASWLVTHVRKRKPTLIKYRQQIGKTKRKKQESKKKFLLDNIL